MVLLSASLGNVIAEPDILKALLESIKQDEDEVNLQIVQEILTSHGYDARNCDVSNLYDTILAICELEYGSYYEWTLIRRYEFDSLMVSLGQLPYLVNLDPSSDILTQEEALHIALATIVERYGISYITNNYSVSVSYTMSESGSAQGMWRYGIEFTNGGDSLFMCCVVT